MSIISYVSCICVKPRLDIGVLAVLILYVYKALEKNWMEKSLMSSLVKEAEKSKNLRKTHGIGYLNDLSEALNLGPNPRKLSMHWSDSSVLVRVLYPLRSPDEVKKKAKKHFPNYLPGNKIRCNTKNKRKRIILNKMKTVDYPAIYSSLSDGASNTSSYILGRDVFSRPIKKALADLAKNRRCHLTNTSHQGQIQIEVPAVSPEYERLTRSTASISEHLGIPDKFRYSLHDKQSLVMSVIALAYSKISCTRGWTRKTLQTIFARACLLYRDVVVKEKTLPCLENLPAVLGLGMCLMRVRIRGDFAAGIMLRNKKKPHLKSFVRGLEEYFVCNKHTRALVKYNGNTCAIWRQSGLYFLFELYPGDLRGGKSGTSTASLQTYNSCRSLARSFTDRVVRSEHDCLWILHAYTVLHVFDDEDSSWGGKSNGTHSTAVEWCRSVASKSNDKTVLRQETLALSHQNAEGKSSLILNELRMNYDHAKMSRFSRHIGTQYGIEQVSESKEDVMYMLECLKSYIVNLYNPSRRNTNDVDLKNLTVSSRNLRTVDSLSTIDLNSPVASAPTVADDITLVPKEDLDESSLLNNVQPISASTPKSSAGDMLSNKETTMISDDTDKTLMPLMHNDNERMIEIHDVTDETSVTIKDVSFSQEEEKAVEQTEVATSSTELKVRDIGRTASEQAMNLHEEIAAYWMQKSV